MALYTSRDRVFLLHTFITSLWIVNICVCIATVTSLTWIRESGTAQCSVDLDVNGVRNCSSAASIWPSTHVHLPPGNDTAAEPLEPAAAASPSSASSSLEEEQLMGAPASFKLGVHSPFFAEACRGISLGCVLLMLPMLLASVLACGVTTDAALVAKNKKGNIASCWNWSCVRCFLVSEHDAASTHSLRRHVRVQMCVWLIDLPLYFVVFMGTGAVMLASSGSLYELSLCCDAGGNEQLYLATIKAWKTIDTNAVYVCTMTLLLSFLRVISKATVGYDFAQRRFIAATGGIRGTRLDHESQLNLVTDDDGDDGSESKHD